MLEIDWDAEKGWQAPTITPYHYLSISPAASALHYGIEVSDCDDCALSHGTSLSLCGSFCDLSL